MLLLAFVAIEARSEHPMLDLSLFRNPAFNGVSAVAFCLSAGMFAMFLYLTLYIQGVLGYSPLEAGLRFLPLTVLSFVAAPIAGKLSNRVPIRFLLGAGLAMVSIGLFLMHGVSVESGWTTLLAGFLVAGVGIGTTNPGIGQAAIAVVPVERSGMGAGINNTFRQVGIATGIAALGAIFQSRVDSKLAELLPGAPDGAGEAISSGAVQAAASEFPSGQRLEFIHAAKEAFISGFNEIILIAAILTMVGAVLGFLLVHSRYFVQAVDGHSGGAGG